MLIAKLFQPLTSAVSDQDMVCGSLLHRLTKRPGRSLTNGGLMKHQTQPNKWLLTTALLAALGANYTFQSSSLSGVNSDGAIELSSEAVSAKPELKKIEATPTKMTPITRQGRVSSVPENKKIPVSTTPVAEKAEEKSEATVTNVATCPTGDCKASADSVILKLEDYKKLVAQIESLKAKPVAAAAASETATVESKYDVCIKTEDGEKETRSEKRERQACEKKEKEKEKTEDRVAKFEEKMEDIKDKCADDGDEKLNCLASGFSDALRRYSGRNTLPANVVQKYFRSVVGTELSKSLFNPNVDNETMMANLTGILDSTPEEYRSLKQITLDSVKNQAKARALAVNQQYKLASQVPKNESAAYLQIMGQAQSEEAELRSITAAYDAAVRTSDSYSSDRSFFSYYNTSYLPNMQKMFLAISNPASTDSTVAKPEATTRGTSTRGTVSDDASTSTNTRGGAPAAKTNDSWNFLSSSSGVNVGAPSMESRGGRTSRQMGQ